MNELVSVIVPVYKTEKYLTRCVNSILHQDYEKFEIILVDDGSPDNSGKICDELAKKDNRIRVIHKENGGLSSARNAGIEEAEGEYICFVDSDDYILTDYISTLFKLIVDNSADLSRIDYAEVTTNQYDEKESFVSPKFFEGKEVEKAFLDLKVDSACVFMYDRNLIGDTRFIVGKTSEDIPFNFEIFQKANKFSYLPVRKYCYYYNPDSISNGELETNKLNYLHFRENIFNYYKDKDDAYLKLKAESQYARAAMGLMARMALYGISEDLNENEYKKMFKSIFEKHRKAFFKDDSVQMSRKVLAILVFELYPLMKMFRRVVR